MSFYNFFRVLLRYRYGVILVSLGYCLSLVSVLFELHLGVVLLSIVFFFFLVIHVPLDRSRKNIRNKKKSVSNKYPSMKLLISF